MGVSVTERSPIHPSVAHARNAKSRAAQQQHAGNLTKKEERDRIERKANRILDD